MEKLLSLLLLFCVFSMALPASADMVLNNAILHFEPGSPIRQDIEIENTADTPLYVKVTPQIVHRPGAVDESREVITDPRAAGLLVTPNRLVVAPHGRKLLRFVNLQPADDAERVYRVAVAPVVGEVEAEQTGVKILVGYEVLVLVQPQRPEPWLIADREGQLLRFHNRGNTNVLLREGRQCPTDDTPAAECAALTGKRLYPGSQYVVNLPYDRPAEYFLSIGTRNSAQVYP